MAFSPLAVLGWITGLPLGQISSDIASVARAKVDAETDAKRLATEEREAALRARQAVLVAEAGNRINAVMRLIFALPVAAYLGKLILWDKVLGLGTTDDLSADLWYYVYVVVGFYFVHWTVGAMKR